MKMHNEITMFNMKCHLVILLFAHYAVTVVISRPYLVWSRYWYSVASICRRRRHRRL